MTDGKGSTSRQTQPESKPVKHCVIRYKEGYVNLIADRMREDDGIVRVYQGEEMTGAFDLGTVDMIYLTESKEARI